MKILLLGGTQEGKQLAERLAKYHQIKLVYSTVRKVPTPTANYTAIHGGFGGAKNLAKKLDEEQFDLLLDMTYPYAAQISKNATIAARSSSTPIWSYHPPHWTATPNDHWHFYDSLTEIISAIRPYQRCFFSIGNGFFQENQTVPPHQQWFIRSNSKREQQGAGQKRLIKGHGPFLYEEALALFTRLKIEVLVSLDSGGEPAKKKVEAAKTTSIPVFFIRRPMTQQTDRQFNDINSLEKSLVEHYCLNVA